MVQTPQMPQINAGFDFARFGDRVAVRDDMGRTICYRELDEFATTLKSVSGRALCVNLCEDSIGALAGYACMISARIVPLMLDSRLDSAALDSLLGEYMPELLWLPEQLKERFLASSYTQELARYGYALLRSPYHNGAPLHNELALLLSTSGSTGSSKMVRQSYENLKSNTESIVQYLGIDSTQRAIVVLPLHYTFGLSVVNTHLYSGAMLLLSESSLMQKPLWEFIKDSKATSIAGVPYTYEMLKKLKFFDMHLPHLRVMTQAGGKLSPELHREFATFAKEQGKAFIVMYGQTEATARMSYLPAHRALDKCGSIGVAIPDGEFSLLDSKRQRIEQAGVQGELVYRGRNVALGYAYDRASLSLGDELGGELETGDIAYKDSEGYYYIVGRKSRFIKMFGRRISLDEVDTLLEREFLGVAGMADMEAKCSGSDDRLCVFITQERGQKERNGERSRECEKQCEKQCIEVRKFLCERLKLTPIAVKVRYVESLPRNSAGKILYSKLDNME